VRVLSPLHGSILLTFTQHLVEYAPPWTIAVADDHADAVIKIMLSADWQLVGKIYNPTKAHIDALQVVVTESTT
jgi:hypothetical protein